MTDVAPSPCPYIAGDTFQRTESPIWGSPVIRSPACNSMMQTRSGAQTMIGRPAPYAYNTRPSAPAAGVLCATRHDSLTWTASKAVAFSDTSVGGWKPFGGLPSISALGSAPTGAGSSGFRG